MPKFRVIRAAPAVITSTFQTSKPQPTTRNARWRIWPEMLFPTASAPGFKVRVEDQSGEEVYRGSLDFKGQGRKTADPRNRPTTSQFNARRLAPRLSPTGSSPVPHRREAAPFGAGSFELVRRKQSGPFSLPRRASVNWRSPTSAKPLAGAGSPSVHRREAEFTCIGLRCAGLRSASRRPHRAASSRLLHRPPQ